MPRNIYRVSVLTALFAFVAVACGDDAADDAGTDAGTVIEEDTDTEYDLDTDTASQSPVSHVTIEMNEKVKTVLNVRWTQTEDADSAWLRFTFENDEWFQSPAASAGAGEREQVILGVPGKTEVAFHVVTETGGVTVETVALTASTGAVPEMMPLSDVGSYDASLASPNRWLFGSVEDTQSENMYYGGPFWLYIIDRQGRIVWYYSDLGVNPVIGFPRISRDGRYIFFGYRTNSSQYYDETYMPKVVKMTLDRKYFEQIEIPLSDNVDMTDDGTLLFDTLATTGENKLAEYLSDGTVRYIWDCAPVFGAEGTYNCYSNTVNWNPLDDTVLLSFPFVNTVVEIDRQTGEMVGQYGQSPGSYSFDPDSSGFDFQHYANITPEGTLMVSTHIPDTEERHAFMEFDIDRENQTLIQKWVYEGNEYADMMGEAHKVPNGNGNVLVNWGTGGTIKEITPDMQVVWQVLWDADFPTAQNNKLVGHCTLLDDLYAINRGPE
jgi:hypothetical protein